MRRSLHPVMNTLTLGVAVVTLTLLYVPLIVVACMSIYKPGYGFTLAAYSRLFHNDAILKAAVNTFLLASISTVIATALGTMLAIGIHRFPWGRPARAAYDLLLYLPVVTPDIIIAAALLVAFGILKNLSTFFDPGLPTMIIGHVSFQIAFVALVVQSRLATIGRGLEEAARDLYASTWQVLWRVTVPMLAPAIVAGAILAITLSLDDFIISFFTLGSDSTTLPILIYNQVGRRKEITPEMHAVATLSVLLTVLLVIGLERLTRRDGKQ